MDTKYIDLKFISGDRTIEVGRGKPYRLLNIEGLSGGQVELSTSSNTLNDGSKVHNRRISFRPMAIECEYVGVNKADERRLAAGFFNVHRGGLLQIDYMGIEREIPYDVEGYVSNPENLYKPFKFLINLYCPEPFLLDVEETSQEIVTWIGGLTFPLRLPTRFAMAGEKIVNVFNSGDVDTPVTIEIFGPAKNPKISKRETGEYLRINKTLTSDDVVKITTGFGSKRAELNGKNAFNLLDLPGSTFFSLEPEDNVVELTTDDVSSSANVRISHRNRYLGI